MQQLLFMGGMAEFINSLAKLALLLTLAPLLVRAWTRARAQRAQRVDEQLGRQSGAWRGHQAPDEQRPGGKAGWLVAMVVVWLLLLVVTSLRGYARPFGVAAGSARAGGAQLVLSRRVPGLGRRGGDSRPAAGRRSGLRNDQSRLRHYVNEPL